MNKKITLPELIESVALATDSSKRVSEMFLKELFTAISETLVAGENVKIKNLGTFKLIEVDSRKSVNVNTGEVMEIPSHTKVSFIPDKSIAESINTPFAFFETKILSDDISEEDLNKISSDKFEDDVPNKEPKQIDDAPVIGVVPPPFNPSASIESNLNGDEAQLTDEASSEPVLESTTVIEDVKEQEEDINAVIDEVESAENEQNADGNDVVAAEDGSTTIAETTVAEDSAVPEETDAKTEEIMVDVPDAHTEVDKEDIAVTQSQDVKNNDENSITDNNESKDSSKKETEEDLELKLLRKELAEDPPYRNSLFSRGFFWGFVTAFVICGVAWYAYYVYVQEYGTHLPQSGEYIDTLKIDESHSSLLDMTDSTGNNVDDSYADELEKNTTEPPKDEKEKIPQSEVVKADVVRRDTVRSNYFLTKMARKYYGNSNFWVYIYEENKNKIKNPNAIAPGTVVVIPDAKKYGIDKDNPNSIAIAKKKMGDILKKYE